MPAGGLIRFGVVAHSSGLRVPAVDFLGHLVPAPTYGQVYWMGPSRRHLLGEVCSSVAVDEVYLMGRPLVGER
jgi:hypothetical protein